MTYEEYDYAQMMDSSFYPVDSFRDVDAQEIFSSDTAQEILHETPTLDPDQGSSFYVRDFGDYSYLSQPPAFTAPVHCVYDDYDLPPPVVTHAYGYNDSPVPPRLIPQMQQQPWHCLPTHQTPTLDPDQESSFYVGDFGNYSYLSQPPAQWDYQYSADDYVQQQPCDYLPTHLVDFPGQIEDQRIPHQGVTGMTHSILFPSQPSATQSLLDHQLPGKNIYKYLGKK